MTTTTTSARFGAIGLLVALTTVLPELLSGNTIAPVLFRPDALVFFALAYGLPVLLIREWAVRLHLSNAGLLLAGMAYGLINEGLLAKTIFRQTGVPIDLFDNYAHAFGVNWGWVLLITAWHGLSSVVFPVALTHLAFPSLAARPWVGKKLTWALATIVVILSSLFFLNDDSSGPKGAALTLAALWAAIGALAFAGSRLRRIAAVSPPVSPWKPFLLGLAGLPLLIAVLLTVRLHPPILAYLAAFAGASALWTWILLRNGWQHLPAFGRVAFGWYAQMAAFSGIALGGRSPVTVAIDALILAALHVLVRRSEKARSP